MNYTEQFKNIESKKVLIIGDVMVDSYIWGNVDRISPEAPVPIVSTTKTENRLGGAANVVKNINALGLEPILCSVIGSDASGEILKEILSQQNITAQGCITSPGRITTTKTRVISGNHQILRIDNEQTDQLDEILTTELRNKIDATISNNDISAIIFQDYDKGVLSPHIIEYITQKANAKSIPILVDPKKRNFWNFKNCTIFKPNFKEFTEGIGKSCAKNNVDELFVLAQEFIKKQNIAIIMITLSEHGIFIANSSQYYHIPTQVRQVSDVSGAGDTVISTATACYIAQLPLLEIAKIANIAGGLACEQPGVVTITKQEILNNL